MILQPVASLQQVGSFGLDALSELVNLSDIDQPGIQMRFQKLQRLLLRGKAGFGIANLLVGLKQSDEASNLTSTTASETGTSDTRSARSATGTSTTATKSGRVTDAAETAGTLTAEA